MDGGDGGQGRGVEPVHHIMGAFERFADAPDSGLFLQLLRSIVGLAQIGAGREAGVQLAVNEEGVGVFLEGGQSGNKLFEFGERLRSQFIAGFAVQRQFNGAVLDGPGNRIARIAVHEDWKRSNSFLFCLLRSAGPSGQHRESPPYTACRTAYMASTSAFDRCAISSRFSLPFAVSNPLSIVNGSAKI